MYSSLALARREDGSGTVAVMPPPPGSQVNFVDPPWNGKSLEVIGIICLVLSITFVAMRLYTRFFILKKVGLDDYAIILAEIFSIPFTALALAQNRLGGGNHLWDIPLTRFSPHYLLIFTIEEPIYTITVMLIKVSILLFLLRLFPVASFRPFAYTTMFIVIGNYIPTAIVSIVSCNPPSKTWNLSVTKGSCIDKAAFYVASSALNVLTDIMIFALPLPTVWALQLPIRQRFGVLLVFMAGLFVIVVSVIRLVQVTQFLHVIDFTWLATTTEIWTVLEVHVAIIVSCMPCAKPLISHAAPDLLGSRNSNHPSSHKLSSVYPGVSSGSRSGHERMIDDSA